MKFPKIAVILAACLLAAVPLMAENPIAYDVSVDFAYYPESANIPTNSSSATPMQFAPITGPFSGVEGRVTFSGEYVIDTPLGDHWLLSGATVAIKESLEFTPVSFMPITSITFTPVPFLVLNGGFQTGTGWSVAGIQGMAANTTGNEYADLTPFNNLFAKYWIQGTFQFDTGVIFPGDWNHLQMMYTYQTYFEGLTGMANQDIWLWQASGNRSNGLKEYQQAILAYQMPLVLSRVGVIFESDRYYSDGVSSNPAWKASFNDLNLSAMCQLTLTENDSLTCLCNFAGRRAFSSYNENVPEQLLDTTGMEWYFKRFAVSYSHKF